MDISSIYSKAFSITLKNKFLWIFGALLAASLLAGFGNTISQGQRYFSPGKSDTDMLKGIPQNPAQPFLDNTGFPIEKVLGLEDFNAGSDLPDKAVDGRSSEQSTQKPPPEWGQLGAQGQLSFGLHVLKQFANLVPQIYWTVLLISFVLSIFIGIFIKTLIKAWARSAILQGVESLESGQVSNLEIAGMEAKKHILQMTLFILVPFFVYLLIVIVPVFTVIRSWIGVISRGSEPFMIYESPSMVRVPRGESLFVMTFLNFGFIAIFSLVYLPLMNLIRIWGSRILVLENKPFHSAIIQGLKLGFKYFSDTFLLAICNFFVALILKTVVIIPIGILGLATYVILKDGGTAGLISIPFLAVIWTLVIFALGVIAAALETFKSTTWTILFIQKRKNNLVQIQNGTSTGI